MKGTRVHYEISGRKYCARVLDVLHIPVQAEAPAGILNASAQRQSGLAIASYVWVPCVDVDGEGVQVQNVRMLPLTSVTVCPEISAGYCLNDHRYTCVGYV